MVPKQINQAQAEQELNPTSPLDPLYCEEDEHYVGEASASEEDDEEDDEKSYHGGHVIDACKSDPDPVLSREEQEQLQSLLSKEEEDDDDGGDVDRYPHSAAARSEAAEWMLKACAYHAFSAVTAVLAVSYLDRFLRRFFWPGNRREEKPWMTQLAAVTCLSLAAKMEETDAPLLSDLQVGDGGFLFEAKTIQRMEVLVLSTLQWRMNPVTPLSFAGHLAVMAGFDNRFVSSEFLRRFERLLLFLILDSRIVGLLPSVVAMAAAIQAMDGLLEPSIRDQYKNRLLRLLPGIDKGKIGECCGVIGEVMEGARSHKRKLRLPSTVAPPGSPSGVVDVSFSSDSSNDSWTAAASPSPPPAPAAPSPASSPERLSKRSRGAPLPPDGRNPSGTLFSKTSI